MQQQQLHVKNNFQLFVPLGGGEARGFAFTQTTAPSFGLTLTKTEINESWHYQVQLVRCEDGTETIAVDGLSWAKRSPYRFQTKHSSAIIEGLYFHIKVEPGVFDFRRVKHNSIRFQVNCFSGGGKLLSTGSSALCKLLPKRRVAEDISGLETEVVIPIEWTHTEPGSDPEHSSSEPSPTYNSSPYDDDSIMMPANENSSFEAMESPDNVFDIEPYSINKGDIKKSPGHLNDEQYMVLYNGNAEVIGNFRALNFYKASDINIKEDIHLLSQDRNPRDILMKIDGVEYKFKQGVRGNNDTNRRFVGYIAQQIESVVPQAVQLIDGILHVDYESLIPYLSESIKQNFNDINNLNSKTDQIHQVVDMLYNEFMKKEGKKSTDASKYNGGINTDIEDVREYRSPKKPWKWIFGTSMAVLLIVSIAIGAVFVWPIINSHEQPTTPSTPTTVVTSPSAPAQPINPIVTPPPLTAGQLRDLAALQDFYNKMNGAHWTNSRKWMTNNTVCEWYGIRCNNDKRVTELSFVNNGLSGSIPSSIANLDQLKVLEIEQSRLDDFIPDTITTLQHLEYLSLTNTALQGTVPAGIFSIPALQSVFLEGNQFSSWQLPSGVNYSRNLATLMLSSCAIIGTVPEELGALRSLNLLRLSNNNVDGTLPSFANTSLQVLIVDGNHLSGSIPLLPSSINRLVIRTNNFTGGLEGLSNLSGQLRQLDLSANSLSGQFELKKEAAESIDFFDISRNYFTAVLPSILLDVKAMRHCDASVNSFQCPIPQWLKNCRGICS